MIEFSAGAVKPAGHGVCQNSRTRETSSTAWLLTGSTLVSATGEMEQFKKRKYDLALTIQSCSQDCEITDADINHNSENKI